MKTTISNILALALSLLLMCCNTPKSKSTKALAEDFFCALANTYPDTSFSPVCQFNKNTYLGFPYSFTIGELFIEGEQHALGLINKEENYFSLLKKKAISGKLFFLIN